LERYARVKTTTIRWQSAVCVSPSAIDSQPELEQNRQEFSAASITRGGLPTAQGIEARESILRAAFFAYKNKKVIPRDEISLVYALSG